jgi:hypothetical protein
VTRSLPGSAGGPGCRVALRRRAGAGAAVAGVVAAVTLAGPAPAAEAAACSGTSGVTVVVDFGPLGGVRVSCAPGDPASGLAALSAAGFGYSFVPRQPGLVCQINGLPDPCNGAPTTAYWSYWHAARGGSWTYSAAGAGSVNPRPGTVQGWAFGAGGRPGVAPPAPAAAPPPPPPPAPEPAPTAKPTTRAPAPPPQPPGAPAPGAPSRAGGTGAPAPGPGSAAAPPGRSPAPRATRPGSPTTSPPSTAGGGSPPGTVAPEGTVAPPASPATEPVGSSGGLGRAALGAAVVGALAATGFLVARRRRPSA